MGFVNYVFIDESGDLGLYGSKYFIIVAIVTTDPKSLNRIIKKFRQRKLKKKIKELPEIKANSSNRRIREHILSKVSNLNCKIFAIVVDKSKILSRLYEVKDKLYNYLCGILLDRIGLGSGKVIITIDKKHTNTLIREDFNSYIKDKIGSKSITLEIYHLPSYSKNELQVADFVAWSISRKFNVGDDFYYKIIEEKIINKENIFLWR